jgi:hypothetical protein
MGWHVLFVGGLAAARTGVVLQEKVRNGVMRCTWVRMRGSGPFGLLSIQWRYEAILDSATIICTRRDAEARRA